MNVNCVYWLKSWGAAGKLEGPYNRRRLKHPYTFKSAATESNPWIKAYCWYSISRKLHTLWCLLTHDAVLDPEAEWHGASSQVSESDVTPISFTLDIYGYLDAMAWRVPASKTCRYWHKTSSFEIIPAGIGLGYVPRDRRKLHIHLGTIFRCWTMCHPLQLDPSIPVTKLWGHLGAIADFWTNPICHSYEPRFLTMAPATRSAIFGQETCQGFVVT